jgi:hypothetical protein
MKPAVNYVNPTEEEMQEYQQRDHEAFERKTVAMDSTADGYHAKLSRLANEIIEEKKAAVAVDHKAADDALTNLVNMRPAARATAFEREARGERVGLNDKLVELRERLEIPEGQEVAQRNDIKNFWNGQHQRNTLNNDLKL